MRGRLHCLQVNLGPMVLVVALLCLPAVARAGAGDDEDLTKRRAPDVEKQQPRVVVRRARVARVQNIAANIDNWVFGFDEGGAPRARLESLLREKIDQVARTSPVSEGQKHKLQLAGEGDIEHLLDRVEQLKAKEQSNEAEADWATLRAESAPLRAAFRGRVFGQDSLFGKTLSTILTPDQIARFQRLDEERSQFQHRAGVHMTVLRLSTALGLSDDQWRRFEAVLLKETRPPHFSSSVGPTWHFQSVYSQVRGMSPEKLQPIFEPWQWEILKTKIGGFQPGGRANRFQPEED